MKKQLIFKILRRIILGLLLVIALFFATCVITEYRPQDQEELKINNEVKREVALNKSMTLVTWNIGYGALGNRADFFMDGGTHVYTANKQRVLNNMEGITDYLKRSNPDIVFIQEIDVCSSRTHFVNETTILSSQFPHYQNTFATNFKTLFIPYPMPPIGKVHSGLLTMSKFNIKTATRLQLPIPFKWPVKMFNLKRCLSVSRLPITDSDKELVCINLHLEAYDNGEGKIEQTKMLKAILDDEVKKGNYVIAGGDFNQVFSNVDVSQYPVREDVWQPGFIDSKDFKNFTVAFDSSKPTCRSLDQPYADADKKNFQYYVIDGLLCSKNIKVSKVKTKQLKFVNSDHNPVKLTFTLN